MVVDRGNLEAPRNVGAQHMHTLGMRNDGRHGEGKAGAVAQAEGSGEKFFVGH